MSPEFMTMRTPEAFNQAGARKLPGHLGILITEVSAARVSGELPVVEAVMAPNGYLPAGYLLTPPDHPFGVRCLAQLSSGAHRLYPLPVEVQSPWNNTERHGVRLSH